MRKLWMLITAVCGLSRRPTVDGRLLPQSVHGLKPVAVVHDRRLSAGIFALRRPRAKSSLTYRVVAWRTYRDKTGKECATTALFRDELDPIVGLIQQCAQRMPHE